MKAIGIDIGTSKISLVVFDGEKIVYKDSRANCFSKEKRQDCQEILGKCLILINDAKSCFVIDGIGISNQMHGILYVDENARAVSDLYTWQDNSGNKLYKDDLTYVQYITKKTGYKMASGFGLATHFYLQENKLIPKNACKLCTIGDYLALSLTGSKEPVMHSSNAASLGLFDLQNNRFDEKALSLLHINPDFLPEVKSDILYEKNILLGVGDNQASYIGAVDNPEGSLLVNIGTGSQISLGIDRFEQVEGMETRPLDDHKYLLVGSALCGGYSYSILSDFFDSVLNMCDLKTEKPMYYYMDTPCFSVNRYHIKKSAVLKQAPAIYIITEGEGVLEGEGTTTRIKKGDYFFLPYCNKNQFQIKGEAQAVECLPRCK